MPKVEPSDSSYMPSLVEVKVGQTVGGLKELKKVSIPSSSREAVLLTGMTEVSLGGWTHCLLRCLLTSRRVGLRRREQWYDHVKKKVLPPHIVLDFRERTFSIV